MLQYSTILARGTKNPFFVVVCESTRGGFFFSQFVFDRALTLDGGGGEDIVLPKSLHASFSCIRYVHMHLSLDRRGGDTRLAVCLKYAIRCIFICVGWD